MYSKLILPTAAAAVSFAALVGAAPAHAHDSLVSTSPAEGETITEDPGVVSLTLTAEPQASASVETTIIEVTAGDGHPASTGDVTIDGDTISTEVTLDHADEYTVDWRTLSADGHPIEGTYTFTYDPEGAAGHSDGDSAHAEDETTPAEESASPSPSPDPTRTADDTETVDAAPAGDSQDNNTGLILGIAALAVAIAAAAAYFLRRRGKTTS